MTLLGADVDQLRELASVLSRAGQDLGSSHGAIEAAMAATEWTGPDASRFRDSWTNDRGALQRASGSLEELAAQIRRNIDEQVRASAGGGPRSTPGGFAALGQYLGPVLSGVEDFASAALAVGVQPAALAEMLNRFALEGLGSDRSAGFGAEGRIDAFLGPRGGASRSLDGSSGHFEAWGQVGAGVDASGSVAVGPGELYGNGEAFAGVEAYAAGAYAFEDGRVSADLQAGAMAGARASGEVGYEIPGVGSASARGSAIAGVGATFDAHGEISWDKVDFEIDTGLAIGVGAELGFDVSFSPEKIYDEATAAIEDAWDDAAAAVEDAWDDAVDIVDEGVESAFKEVGGWIGL